MFLEYIQEFRQGRRQRQRQREESELGSTLSWPNRDILRLDLQRENVKILQFIVLTTARTLNSKSFTFTFYSTALLPFVNQRYTYSNAWFWKWKTLALPIWRLELITNKIKQNYQKQRDLAPLIIESTGNADILTMKCRPCNDLRSLFPSIFGPIEVKLNWI